MKTTFVGEDENKNEKKHGDAHKGEAEKVHIAGLKGGQRVKIVEAAPTEEAPVIEEGVKKTPEKKIVEKVRGKKYLEAKAKVDHSKQYSLAEAVKLAKETSYSKFGGSLELHIVVKKVGTNLNVALPHSLGKEKKIEIATDETIEKLKAGKIDFDVLISSPAMMPKLVPFARLLGPKGLMPNPKNGTLVPDPEKAKSASGNSITVKTEKEAPLIHLAYGKMTLDDKDLVENAQAILAALNKTKQIERAFTKATMGPAIHLKI